MAATAAQSSQRGPTSLSDRCLEQSSMHARPQAKASPFLARSPWASLQGTHERVTGILTLAAMGGKLSQTPCDEWAQLQVGRQRGWAAQRRSLRPP